MTIANKLTALLGAVDAPYRVIRHHRANTAVIAANSERVPLHEHAKVVLFRADERNIMAVLPADRRVDMARLRELACARELRMDWEEEMAQLFRDCEPGAMPPFGELYGIEVYVDISLAENEYIVFSAGSHKESVRMGYADYANIVRPVVGSIALRQED